MHAGQACGAGEAADTPGRVAPAQLGQFGDQSIDTQTALVVLVDLFDHLGQFRVFSFSIRLVSFQRGVESAAGYLEHFTHQGNGNSGFARFASFFSIQMTDEGELHMLSFANHAAAFFRISRSIFKRRFSSSNSFNRARSSISSGFSLKSPRFFAAFIQFPNVPSLIPRSRAISAIGLPELINNSTASALNSGVNFRRVEPITVLLLVDNHSTSVTVYGSDRPPADRVAVGVVFGGGLGLGGGGSACGGDGVVPMRWCFVGEGQRRPGLA